MSVRVERQGAITTVILERPHARNAVDPSTARALYDAFVAFDRDPDAAVAVLWGAGGTFCAGFDLKALADGSAADWLPQLHFGREGSGDEPAQPPLGPMGPTRLQLTKPVIAAIAGAAVAGGLELALWCDLRVMERDAYAGVYCRRWGVPLLDGGTVRLPRVVGMGRAADLILTGRRVDAEECLRIGLCDRVVDVGAARAQAEALAAEIARFPAGCMRADRASLYAQGGRDLQDALRLEFEGSLGAVTAEGVDGASRFAAGKGRHGEAGDV